MELLLPQDLDVSILTIYPKEAFFEWAKSIEDAEDDSDIELEFEDMQNDTSAYVVPSIESLEDLQVCIDANFKTIFENELFGWCTDVSKWPDTSDFNLFNDWFGLSVHSMAFDLTGDKDEEQDD